jgi:hypothetical protein
MFFDAFTISGTIVIAVLLVTLLAPLRTRKPEE